jgi:filamentous hemagglutinin family protein
VPDTTPKTLRQNLLHGVSFSALLVAAAAGPQARAGGYRSLNQALAAASSTAATSAQTGLAAAKQAALGTQNLANAQTRFASMTQALKKAAAASSPGLPAGVTGLVVGDGVVSNTGTTNTALWSGAAVPTAQSLASSNVTITQTSALAQLTWKTFNVAPNQHLTFNQSAGGSQASSWIVINSVQDPNARPSEILGDISATGKVYILNGNGIIFGAGSTVNVGSLIAATADIASAQFSQNADGSTNFSLYGSAAGKPSTSFLPTFVPFTTSGGTAITPGNITVDAGAVIETAAPTGSNGGGYVMLLGGNVSNAGAIMTPQGQTVLAGGTSFILQQGFSGSVSSGNTLSTTIGSDVDAANSASGTSAAGQPVFTTGTVQNSGLIVSDQGDISLVGHQLIQAQGGVLLSTTTVNTRGTVHLLTDLDDTSSSITLAPGSTIEILPEDNGLTALDAQRAANISNSATLNALRALDNAPTTTSPGLADTSNLADILGESRIELSSGGTIDLQPGALAIAQGGQVAIGAGRTALVQSGATIDVSGTDYAVLPASINDLLVSVQPYQLRDSAGNRDGALKSTNLNVDARSLIEIAGSGPYAGNIYSAGGLLEVSGYLGLVPHGITEWTAIGGQVILQAQSPSIGGTVTGGAVITEPGAIINVQGGVVNYAAGEMPQSYVTASDGVIYNVNDAPGNLVYTGVYTGETEVHTRWHVTDTYVNPLLTPSEIMEPAYSIGRDAGTVTVYAATAQLQGSVYAGVSVGADQSGARPSGITDPYLLAQTVAPQAGTLTVGFYTNNAAPAISDTAVSIGSAAAPASAGGSTAAPVSALDAGAIAAAGLAALDIDTGGDITVSAPLSVAYGGTVSLVGSTIEADASISARGGGISLSDHNALATADSITATPSITLAAGATLDARGVWTNALLDPSDVSGEAFANGGTVTIESAGALSLAPGSTIDVSSGGALLSNGKLLTAAGGSVSLIADIVPTAAASSAGTGAVLLGATIAGYGSGGAGTLSIEAPQFVLGAAPASAVPAGAIAVSSSLFQLGFAAYVLNGFGGVSVTPGAQVSVTRPVYILTNPAGAPVPSGADPSQAYSVVLPALYTPNLAKDSVTQRAGASLSLVSSAEPSAFDGGGGPLTIGAGASVAVDPGQSISLVGYGQVTVLGTLTAHGGSISVVNTQFAVSSDDANQPIPFNYQPGVSVWIGGDARLDVSGQDIGFVNSLGQRFAYSAALAGGSITLGSDAAAGGPTTAQVIVRPNAVLDADGASAIVEVVPLADIGTLASPIASPGALPAPLTLAGAGGTITAASSTGVALDGSFSAAAAGPSAAGGVLNLNLQALPLTNEIFPAYLDQPEQLLVSSTTTLVLTDPALQPGQVAPAASFELARISQAQIDAGGFGEVNLTSSGDVVLQGSVALSAPRSLSINAGVIGDSVAGSSPSISAPVVSFSNSGTVGPNVSAPEAAGTLTVTASLINFSDDTSIGGSFLLPDGTVGSGAPPGAAGFAAVDADSSGDIRFLGGTLQTSGNFTFTAAELVPASGVSETVVAGLDKTPSSSETSVTGTAATTNVLAGGTISVFGNGGTQNPISIGGTLALVADTIVQDGVIRAPEGEIRLGYDAADQLTPGTLTAFTASVVLDAGSVTSVSLYGETIPYGGTVDGVNYLVGIGSEAQAAALFNPLVEVEAEQFTASAGSTLDLRGGGTLAGDGFVAGRGGSADVLRTPLLDISGAAAVANADAQVAAVAPVNSNDPVYAILPSYAGNYAPAAYPQQDAGYSPTVAGEQITVGSQIPGLKAGTYTLLPAYYALLPGAYRVELTSGTLPAGSIEDVGNFTSAAPVSVQIAGTGISSQLPVAALFTSSANVNQLAQYDTESYNSFEASAGATFGTPRPFLPEDAKTLLLNYPSQVGTGTALSLYPGALLDAPNKDPLDPVPVGYGLTLEITSPNPIEVTAPGGTSTASGTGTPTLVLDSGVLSALDVPRLVLGGTVSLSGATLSILGFAPGVTLDPGAVVTAGDVMLTVSPSSIASVEQAITVSSGATISNLGSAAFDSTQGFYFLAADGVLVGETGAPVLDVSSGEMIFVPSLANNSAAAVVVDSGASLIASGSLEFVAPQETSVTIGNATLDGRFVSISVSALNIGTAAALAQNAAVLPPGLDLSVAQLDSLLYGTTVVSGTTTLTVPGASLLQLTATGATNIIGSVTIGTSTAGSANLVLTTPAIYGYGASTDIASIQVPTFTWSGIETQDPNATGAAFVPTSLLPAAQIIGSATHTMASLSIDTQTTILGYGPQTIPDDQVQLDRLVAGFASVTVTAAGQFTANNQDGLAVYATVPDYGQAGVGGNLTIASPLVTTASAAVLQLTTGGTLTLTHPAGVSPAATGTISTLGGEIGLTAQEIDIGTAVALPAGRLTATAQDAITIDAGTSIDLAGRTTALFDQTAQSPGGALLLESTAGNITDAAGATINVSSPGAAAGTIGISALAGVATIDGVLTGTAAAGQTAGTFSLIAGTLAAAGTISAFDQLNGLLDSGGFTGERDFELATGNLTIDQTIKASTLTVTADTGNILVDGTIDASGAGPGSIALSAGGSLTVAASAVLDAHATGPAIQDSYHEDIDAENVAHVTLTSTGGSLVLDGGASIKLGYADSATNPQGELVLNAPREATQAGVAASTTGSIDVTGALSVDVYAFKTFTTFDSVGSISQTQTASPTGKGKTLGLDQIQQADQVWALGLSTAGVTSQLGGLTGVTETTGTLTQSAFNLRPGVQIAAGPNSDGTLTIIGDLDFSTLRINDPAGFGQRIDPQFQGSGEPGVVVFRASGDLVINGSISDGFKAPPDSQPGRQISADSGWQIISIGGTAAADPLASDLYLPASLSVTSSLNGVAKVTDSLLLAAGTTFDNSRAISLNYDITIQSATINQNVLIPFAFEASGNYAVPAGGFIATSTISSAPPGHPFGPRIVYQAGQLVPATVMVDGTVAPNMLRNPIFAAGAVLPFQVTTAPTKNYVNIDGHETFEDGTVVPAGTLLDIFNSDVTLAGPTAELSAGAFIPSNTVPVFETIDTGTIAGKPTTFFEPVNRVELRADIPGTTAQGYLDPLAAMLPAGTASWSMNFVSGADLSSADRLAVLPLSQLNGGALAPAATLASQAPGSLILDDQHYTAVDNGSFGDSNISEAFSVIRTGTGDMNFAVGGNFDQSSLYGIYTAGTQTYLPGTTGGLASAQNTQFDLPRMTVPFQIDGSIKPILGIPADQGGYQAYYPNEGGNLSLTVQGNATGDLLGQNSGFGLPGESPSDAIGNWLWTQGGTLSASATVPTAWWINFGAFASINSNGPLPDGHTPQLVGFQGIGTLGGGNLTVNIGGNAGQTTDRGGAPAGSEGLGRGEGLVLAVASTGRLPTGGTADITGGGTLTLHVGGTLNPLDVANSGAYADPSLDGDIIDLRGTATVSAGAIGRVVLAPASGSSQAFLSDPGALDPFTPVDGVPYGGITLVPGDATIDVTTMRDLVIDGAGDAGRETQQNIPGVPGEHKVDGTTFGLTTGFTLWQPTTAIDLFAAGGNLTPTSQAYDLAILNAVFNDLGTDSGRFIYPATLLATAATGSIIYGAVSISDGVIEADSSIANAYSPSLETMPAPLGQVAFLAGTSIYANGEAVDLSGANPALLSSPTRPSYEIDAYNISGATEKAQDVTGIGNTPDSLFAQEPDTPTSDLHADDPTPARFYAAGGDIVDFISGETITFPAGLNEAVPVLYLAAKPVWIMASEDIVSSGTRPLLTPPSGQQNQYPVIGGSGVDDYSSGDLFYNTSPNSISVVSAGRDILSGYFYVGGASPSGAGVLEVDAGRNLYQAAASISGTQVLDFGSIKSIGALIEGSPVEGGADLAVLTGVGADPNYSAFANLYLDPANLANPALDSTNPANLDKVQVVYGGTTTANPLYQYLATYYGYTGSPAGELAAFQALPAAAQDVFLRDVFFDETSASGLQYNDPASRFYHSYARGRLAIDTFFLPLVELNTFLSENYGYTGGEAGAAAYFATLTPLEQKPFMSAIFKDDEIPRSGNSAVSPALSTLLGTQDLKLPGVPDGYTGATTMYSGPVTLSQADAATSNAGEPAPETNGNGTIGVTDGKTFTASTFDAGLQSSAYGGTIQAFDPGGSIVLGVAGSPAPGANTGIITNGTGDIDIFADGSVLLGKSRIFTTDGGNILIWSASGDINAGVGAKTTVVYNPPITTYDNTGGLTIRPAIPSSGAGIATLQPLSDIPAGNVDLIAPIGTIDAGEAGIRVSGNLNLAAAVLANTANIAVGGKTSGVTSVSVASVGAVAAASSAAGAAQSAAQNSAASHAQQDQPSVIEVAVLSISGGDTEDEKRRRRVP